MTFLDLLGVSKRHSRSFALQRLDLGVEAGTRLAVLGPSGSGKTTLLRLVAGFERPDAGRIVLGGTILADGPRVVPAHERGVGYVTQDGALFPHLSVADNIGFGLPRRASDRRSRIADLLALVELDPVLLDRRPDQLSGGQQQRVALARALARRPRLMLLDEPFSALDAALRASTRRVVGRLLADAGITTILVTHDQEEALSFADRIAVMRNGELAQVGTPREVYQQPVDEVAARLLGEAIVLPARLANGWATCRLGRIPIHGVALTGTAQVLLRPEQIRLVPNGQQGLPDWVGASTGRVTEVEFGGSRTLVTVTLAAEALPSGPPDTLSTVRVPVSSTERFEVGSSVSIELLGTAHVLWDRRGAQSEHVSSSSAPPGPESVKASDPSLR